MSDSHIGPRRTFPHLSLSLPVRSILLLGCQRAFGRRQLNLRNVEQHMPSSGYSFTAANNGSEFQFATHTSEEVMWHIFSSKSFALVCGVRILLEQPVVHSHSSCMRAMSPSVVPHCMGISLLLTYRYRVCHEKYTFMPKKSVKDLITLIKK